MMRKWILSALAVMLLCFGSVQVQAEEEKHGECTGYCVPLEIVELQKADDVLPVLWEDANGEFVCETVYNANKLAVTYTDAELTADAVRNRILAMKSAYPEGMSWTNDNFYAWDAGYYSGGYGCAGFAFLLSDAAFGDMPARILEDNLYSNIRVGDILRINNDTHSVVVLEVYDSYIVVAEGNYNSSIHWGRQIARAQLEAGALTYIMTRYPNDVVTHDYQVVAQSGNELTMQCTICGKQKQVSIPTSVKMYIGTNSSYYWSSAFDNYGIPLEVNELNSYILLAEDGDISSTLQIEIADSSVATFTD